MISGLQTTNPDARSGPRSRRFQSALRPKRRQLERRGYKRFDRPEPLGGEPQDEPLTVGGLPTSESGQAVVIAVLIVGVLLSIALTLSLLFIPKIRASSEIKKSSAALYAAESAIEWCLYVNRHSVVAMPVMANSANYENALVNPPRAFVAGDCSGSQIRAIGTYQGISRTFEVSF